MGSFILLLIALFLLDVLAMRYGADSRPEFSNGRDLRPTLI
jgi:hypothetical protein